MRTVLQHLGDVCRTTRLDAHVRQIEVSTSAGVTDTIVSRFENGTGTPRDLERIVSAYASECHADPYELWMQALHAWRDEHT